MPPLSTHCPQTGDESNYLRAQIARISHTTVCCLSGSFSIDDETNQLVQAEDYEGVQGRDAAQVSAWVHK